MNKINDIILTLSSEEQRRFVLYLDKNNKRDDTKNVELFKLLASNEFNSKEIYNKLYSANKANAYHALRKRLYTSLIDFVANISLEGENSIDIQIIKYILASRTFLQENQFKVAFSILNKAEILANEHHLYALLSEIYHTLIQYSYSNDELSIDDIVNRSQENDKNLQLENQLNIVYAKIKKTLNNYNYESEVVDFRYVFSNTLKDHDIGFNETLSFKSLYQLMTIASSSAFLTKDFLQIEPFLIEAYQAIISNKHKQQLHYHIQVLYIIANTLFRNKKFSQSLNYLNQMQSLMHKGQKKNSDFNLKYYLLLGLNLNYSNKQELAIETLEKVAYKKHPDIESLLNINLSLISFYFQKTEFKKAHTILSKFYHTDQWYTKKAGIEWVIKKNLIEILLHIELKNIDLIESRILSFKRKHFDYLKSIKQERVITFLLLIEEYYKNPEKKSQLKFHTKIEQSFEWVGARKEDIFVMSFYAWLKSKLTNSNLYNTTLNLIQKAQVVNN